MWLLAATAAFAVATPTPLQWELQNTGLPTGAPDADVGAPSAWEITTGSRSVIVAVIDTGVDVAHPELAPAVLSSGYDFYDHDSDTFDYDAHGTLVAGLIAGRVTGLAPGVSLLPVKIFSDTGLFDEAVASSGINFALAKGARVLQIAWELSGPPGPELTAAFDAARAADALVVISAGNDGIDLDQSPVWPASLAASYPNVMAVASTDRYDRPVDLPGLFVTNYGPATVDLAAPSEKVLTTYPGGGHLLFTGTSASSPLVSAAAALMLSVKPSLTAAELRALLDQGADRLPALSGLVTSAGRLDAGNSVRLALGGGGSPPVAASVPVASAVAGIPVLFDGAASSSSAGRWSFGDGNEFPSPVGEHAYETGGEWPATLQVVGSSGLRALTHLSVSVPERWTGIPQTLESQHPYPAGTQLVLPVVVPGARWIRLHFSQVQTAGNDALILYDGQATGLMSLQGSFSDLTSAPIPGDSAYLYLRGFTGGVFGFALDRVDAENAESAEHAPLPVVQGLTPGVSVGVPAALSAAGSSDLDGDPLTFQWQLLSTPPGSTAALTTTTGATTSLTPDLDGAYGVLLTASDGILPASTLTWVVTRSDSSGSCEMGPGRPLMILPLILLLLPLARRARR